MKKYIIAAALLVTLGYSSAEAAGPYCREYTQKFVIGGHNRVGYGTACMQPDGSWAIQEPAQPEGEELANSETYVIDSPQPVYAAPQPYYYARPYPYYPAPAISLGFAFGRGGYGHHGYHGGHHRW